MDSKIFSVDIAILVLLPRKRETGTGAVRGSYNYMHCSGVIVKKLNIFKNSRKFKGNLGSNGVSKNLELATPYSREPLPQLLKGGKTPNECTVPLHHYK